GRAARWPEGPPRHRERLSRIERELGGDLARPQAARAPDAEAGDRRWPPRDLGRAGRRVPGGEGAAGLEPSPPERARQAAVHAAEGDVGAASESAGPT